MFCGTWYFLEVYVSMSDFIQIAVILNFTRGAILGPSGGHLAYLCTSFDANSLETDI